MEEIKGQKRVVLDIVKENNPIMTQNVKILAMRQGVSCGDRYLRWLKKEGEIFSYKLAGDRTYTWRVMGKNVFSGVADKVFKVGENRGLIKIILKGERLLMKEC